MHAWVCESESIIHPPVRVNSERWGWISVEANDWALFLRSRHQRTNEQLGGEIPGEEEALSHQSSLFVSSSPWEYWRRGSGRGWAEMESCSRLIMASRTERDGGLTDWGSVTGRCCTLLILALSLARRSCGTADGAGRATVCDMKRMSIHTPTCARKKWLKAHLSLEKCCCVFGCGAVRFVRS